MSINIKKKPNIFESMGIAGSTAVFVVNFMHPLDLLKHDFRQVILILVIWYKEKEYFHFGKVFKQHI